MTENSNLEQRLGDLERRHRRTRKLLVDALSLSAVLAALFYFKPDGVSAFAVGFIGALLVPAFLNRWFLRDRTPQEAKREANRDLVLERWSLIVAAAGISVLIAAVAWFVVTGMNIPSVG